MKKFILMPLLAFSTVAIALPTTWHETLETRPECKLKASFWVLKDSPFAYLILNSGKNIPMYQQLFVEPNSGLRIEVYSSISKSGGLDGLPTYELSMPTIIMSSLPTLKISFSGVQQQCLMEFNEREGLSDQEMNNDTESNVGSIGHGR